MPIPEMTAEDWGVRGCCWRNWRKRGRGDEARGQDRDLEAAINLCQPVLIVRAVSNNLGE